MAPSSGRNVKLIVSAAASVASVPSRIVDTFGQRDNDAQYTRPSVKQSSKMAAMMKNGDWSRVSHPVCVRLYCFRNQPAAPHDN